MWTTVRSLYWCASSLAEPDGRRRVPTDPRRHVRPHHDPMLFLATGLTVLATIGIDIGSANSVISTARRGGVDVLVNEASQRQTPSMVAFNAQRRLLGQSAAAQQTSSPADCVGEIKTLLGLTLAEARRLDPLPAAMLVEAEGGAG